MKRQIVAKVAAVTALMALLFSGCKTQGPGNGNANNAGAANPESLPQKTEASLTHIVTAGIPLRLPIAFADYTGEPIAQGFDYLYADEQITIGISSEKRPENETLEGFVNQEAAYFHAQATQKDGIWTISYESAEYNEPQTMVNAYYEDAENYWRVQGYCPSQCYEQYKDLIWQYITSTESTDN